VRNLLLLILIVVVAWRVAQVLRRKRSFGAKGAAVAGHMVCCSQCGLYLPQGEALVAGDRYYCSEEHLHAHDAQR